MAAALQYLESLRNANPELSDWYAALSDLYQRKLRHQLTLELEQFVVLAVFRDLAFDLSLSALLGKSIYNFGELLARPVIKSLLGTIF
ncbi:26S proteasome non-ATPase regulatory subunit 13 homolog A-like [Salvia miltiorrhiza]|uniref:26S proteasome non-ATPase regulatory subunit 13 homolog A-like n=1 Tax=Salvia miltiorrhiza TaxID=226208 RepID=UPI0025ABF99B|nr:26S proteasome non-ATPase regulatory subunit 13 homolog A-like [Salvia miltiorrhiza]